VAFSPDGRRLAVGYNDGDCTVRVWDLATGALVRQLRGHTQGVYAVAWNRAGTLLATGSLDRTARLWDATVWEEVYDWRYGTPVYGVGFSADDRLLACACGDNLVRFLDVNSRRETAELSGHSSYVHFLAFSPDGTRMATASGDRTIRLWDTLPRAARERR
jgi:WD40 repeat protein